MSAHVFQVSTLYRAMFPNFLRKMFRPYTPLDSTELQTGWPGAEIHNFFAINYLLNLTNQANHMRPPLGYYNFLLKQEYILLHLP